MTEKELRRLSRADLLEMLIDQSVELQQTQERLKEAEDELRSRSIKISQAGSIAEAALQLNNVFEAAQSACAQYMENIQGLSGQQTEICRRQEDETRRRCAALEEETRIRCEQMMEKAKAESAAILQDVTRRLEIFCAEAEAVWSRVQTEGDKR